MEEQNQNELNDLTEILTKRSEFKKKYGYDPLKDERWREKGCVQTLNNNGYDIRWSSDGYTGEDATGLLSEQICSKIEIKTRKYNESEQLGNLHTEGCFPALFDKQENPEKRERTLNDVGALVWAVFHEAGLSNPVYPLFMIALPIDESVHPSYHEMMHHEQQEYVRKSAASRKWQALSFPWGRFNSYYPQHKNKTKFFVEGKEVSWETFYNSYNDFQDLIHKNTAKVKNNGTIRKRKRLEINEKEETKLISGG